MNATFTAINTWAAAWNEHACVLEDLDANLDRFEALIERIRDAKRFPAIDMEAAIEALIEAVEDLPVETAWDFGRLRPALPE